MSPFPNAMETIQRSNIMNNAFEQHLACYSSEQSMATPLHCKNVCRHKAELSWED